MNLYRNRKSQERWARAVKEAYMCRSNAPSDLIGITSEDQFERMTRSLMEKGSMPWLKGIARATVSEDWLMKIDFRLRAEVVNACVHEFTIPVNVKSSFTGRARFFVENPGSDVEVAVMYPFITEERLLPIIETFYRRAYRKHIKSLSPR